MRYKHFPTTVLHNTEISDKEKFHYMLKQEDLFIFGGLKYNSLHDIRSGRK